MKAARANGAHVKPVGTKGTKHGKHTFAEGKGTHSALPNVSLAADADESKSQRAARFAFVPDNNRYMELKEGRQALREQAIAQGLIHDPNKRVGLEHAIDFRGTCQDMCPEYEREEREYQKSLDKLEMIPGTTRVDPKRAVKSYHRPAAGNEQPLPSDVRPPPVLRRTLDYLIDEIVMKVGLQDSHAFVRDRTRSIRQDFTLQNIRDVAAVEVHERIARYHILCCHRLRETEGFSEQQELEQLRKVLYSLGEFYDELSADGIQCPNEAEFRAYHLLTYLRDSDMIRQVQFLPHDILFSPWMQRALDLHSLVQKNNEMKASSTRRNKAPNCEAAQNFVTRFFQKVADEGTPYLMACVLEPHFPDIRRGFLKAFNSSTNVKIKGPTVEQLTDMLYFDAVEQCLETVEHYHLPVDENQRVQFGHKKNGKFLFYEPISDPKQGLSVRLIESKRTNGTDKDLINGTSGFPKAGFSTVLASKKTQVVVRAPSKIPSRPAGTTNASIFSRPPVEPTFGSKQAQSGMVFGNSSETPSAFGFASATKPTSQPISFSFANNTVPFANATGFVTTKQAERLIPSTQPSPLSFQINSIVSTGPSGFGPAATQEDLSVPVTQPITSIPKPFTPASTEVDVSKQVTPPAPEPKAAVPIHVEHPKPLSETLPPQFLSSIVDDLINREVSSQVEECLDAEQARKQADHFRREAQKSQLSSVLSRGLIGSLAWWTVHEIFLVNIWERQRARRAIRKWRAYAACRKQKRQEFTRRLREFAQSSRNTAVVNPAFEKGRAKRLLGKQSPSDYVKRFRPSVLSKKSWGDYIDDTIVSAMESKNLLWGPINIITHVEPIFEASKQLSQFDGNQPHWCVLVHNYDLDDLSALWMQSKLGVERDSTVSMQCGPKLDLVVGFTDIPRDFKKFELFPCNALMYQLNQPPNSAVAKTHNWQAYWLVERRRFEDTLVELSAVYDLSRIPVLLVYWPAAGDDIRIVQHGVIQSMNIRSLKARGLLSCVNTLVMPPAGINEALLDKLGWLASKSILDVD